MTDALGILREMVGFDPIIEHPLDEYLRCQYCLRNGDNDCYDDGHGHTPDCPWLRGRQLIAKYDKATERRPLD